MFRHSKLSGSRLLLCCSGNKNTAGRKGLCVCFKHELSLLERTVNNEVDIRDIELQTDAGSHCPSFPPRGEATLGQMADCRTTNNSRDYYRKKSMFTCRYTEYVDARARVYVCLYTTHTHIRTYVCALVFH